MPSMPTRPLLSGHVLEQPVDGVVGVGAFVDGLGSFGSRGGRCITNLPFGLEAAADVLEDEDVALVGQLPNQIKSSAASSFEGGL